MNGKTKPSSSKVWICEISRIEENGDGVVQLPEELVSELELLGWREGDVLSFSMNEDEKGVVVRNVSLESRGADSFS